MKVIGLDVLLEVAVDSVLTTLGGQRDVSMEVDTDDIDISSKDGLGWKQNRNGLKGWSIDIDTIMTTGDSANAALKAAFNAGTPIQVRIKYPDGSKDTGNALVKSFSTKAPMNGETSGAIKMKGDGPLIPTTETVTAPTISNPTAEEIDITLDEEVTTSAFAVSAGSDTHAATEWQVTADADTTFASPVININSTTAKTALTLAVATLALNTEYRIRARHRGANYGWSAWSAALSFTTVAA